MKIGVIGANGNLGSRIVKYALESKINVKAFVYKGDCLYDIEFIEKNLFDLTRDDIQDIDVLISAFGSGFKVDPIINKKAFIKYIELLEYTDKKLVAIGGAGSLYTDNTHRIYEYQSDSHPAKLKEISKNIRLGIDEIENNKTFDWTVVCPSRRFDLNGSYSGNYIVGERSEIIYNKDNQSYITYEDLAKAMVDIAKNDLYKQQVITIASKYGGK